MQLSTVRKYTAGLRNWLEAHYSKSILARVGVRRASLVLILLYALLPARFSVVPTGNYTHNSGGQSEELCLSANGHFAYQITTTLPERRQMLRRGFYEHSFGVVILHEEGESRRSWSLIPVRINGALVLMSPNFYESSTAHVRNGGAPFDGHDNWHTYFRYAHVDHKTLLLMPLSVLPWRVHMLLYAIGLT